jgi:succinoglycan biosynthesis protein ExoA
VQQQVPSITIIIAARPGQVVVQAVPAARLLDYPAASVEIIVARGKQPSAQRNAALRAARHELIYFLDDDSVPDRGNLRRAINEFSRPEVKMVGGPNVCPREAPALEQVFALVLSSWLAFGPSRARYTPVGSTRASSEKELILCNLMARREALLGLGGFNEALYPNEENALMDELQKRGGKLIYDPEFVVFRRPRGTLRAFARMLMTYGRGRAEQFRLHPTFGSALNFVPPLFLVYLLSLISAVRVGPIILLPLAAYGLCVLAQAGALGFGRKGATLGRALACIPLIFLTHVLYGFGFWRGLFTPLNQNKTGPQVEVKLEYVSDQASEGQVLDPDA